MFDSMFECLRCGDDDAIWGAGCVMGVPELLAPPAAWGPGTPPSDMAAALAACDAETALSVVDTMERLKRWADGVAVAATRVLAQRVTAAHIDDYARDRDGELSERAELDAAHEAQLAVADEIAIATGLGAGQSRDLVGVACSAPERTAVGMTRLLAGETSLHRVVTLWRECRELAPHLANDIADKTLAPTRDGVPLSHRLFRQRLNRHLARHQTTRRRREKGVAARDINCWQSGEGTGELVITGATERTIAAHTRISEIATRIRDTGDPRTLAQLRSDVALDLLLYGSPHTRNTSDPRHLTHPGETDGSLSAALATAVIAALPEQPVPWWEAFTGSLPPARVTVTVPLSSLLGTGDEPGEIATTTDAEFVPAWLTRDIAFAAGSTWRRLVTDPHTGYALGAVSGSYTPPPQMKAYVHARDHHCRAPGCAHPASRCDLDHSEPWPRGTTSDDNLADKHRRHHNHKTRRLWACRQQPNGTIEWTLSSGRTYTTLPHSYGPGLAEQSESLHRLLGAGDTDTLAALHTVLDVEHVGIRERNDESGVRPRHDQALPFGSTAHPRLPLAHVRPVGLIDVVIFAEPALLLVPNHEARDSLPSPGGPGEPPF